MSILENFEDAAELYDDDVSYLFATVLKKFLDDNFDKVKNLTIDEDDEDDMEDDFISEQIVHGITEMNFIFAILDNKWTRLLSVQILENGRHKAAGTFQIGYNTTKEELLQSIESDFLA